MESGTATLFLDRDAKERLLSAAEFRLPGVMPRGFDKVKRLLWAIEETPPLARTAEVLSAKTRVVRSTYHAALELAKSLGVLQIADHRGRENTFYVDWQRVRSYVPQEAVTHASGNRTGPIQIGRVRFKSEGSDLCDSRPKTPKSDGSDRHDDECIYKKTSIIPHGARSPGGWPGPVTVEVLRSPERIEVLFRHALARRWIDLEERVAFFAAARACRRGAESGYIKSSGAKFTAIVKAKDWSFASDTDRERAAAAIAQLDRRRPLTHVHPAGS